MKISYLKPFYYSYYFKIIEANLLDWNIDTVEGKGFYLKIIGSKYGQIELKFYKTIESNHSNKIIWNISDKQIPSDYNYKPHVEKVLTFL